MKVVPDIKYIKDIALIMDQFDISCIDVDGVVLMERHGPQGQEISGFCSGGSRKKTHSKSGDNE